MNSNVPSNFVRAYNCFSCSVACVLSICYDAGLFHKVSETDESIITNPNYFKYFPNWNPDYLDNKPGMLNDDGIIKLAEVLNIVSINKTKVKSNVDEDYVRTKFGLVSTIGILILTHKNDTLQPWNHCFKLADIIGEEFSLMNPSTNDKNQIVKYRWPDISAFESSCIVFE